MKKIILKMLMLISAGAVWLILLAKDKVSDELNPEVIREKITNKVKKAPIEKLRELIVSLDKLQEELNKNDKFKGLKNLVSVLKEIVEKEIKVRDERVKKAKEKRKQKKEAK